MMNYKKIIPQIINSYEGNTKEFEKEGLSEHIVYELDQIQKIKNGIYKNKEIIERESKKFNLLLEELNKNIQEIQNRCNHWELTYYDDSAGGLDSYFQCEICGLQKKDSRPSFWHV